MLPLPDPWVSMGGRSTELLIIVKSVETFDLRGCGESEMSSEMKSLEALIILVSGMALDDAIRARGGDGDAQDDTRD